MKSFLVWNIYFIFLKQWLIAIFYKSTEEYLDSNIAFKHDSNKFFLLSCRLLGSNFD